MGCSLDRLDQLDVSNFDMLRRVVAIGKSLVCYFSNRIYKSDFDELGYHPGPEWQDLYHLDLIRKIEY